ncbi:MAG: hypothetical protein EI684_14720 [Candidatus Viridilinea halotolerans]|uniref:Uncharacterized protein n=1 Tax=Candidatus Viridilinea halotolerans TaxID=2491704 RepID=A0A426TW70_9CHLR|nr:MAG: hypothetical protein EI684_14720 [Candidatus Viridilinea halotolerans]
MPSSPPNQPYTAASGLFGPPRADRAVVTANILKRPTGEYTNHDIRNVILPAYWECATHTGLDPVLVLAQSIHETGNFCSWWAARPRRNPAGIGVNGRTAERQPPGPYATGEGWEFNTETKQWQMGLRYATWQDDAIPIHIGRLLAYLLPAEAGTPAQRELIERALAQRPLPAALRGSVHVLRQLGRAHNPTGIGWASPGTYYGERIAAVANGLTAG